MSTVLHNQNPHQTTALLCRTPAPSIAATGSSIIGLPPQVPAPTIAFTIPAAPKEPPMPRYAPGPGEYETPAAPHPGPAFSLGPRHAPPSAAGDLLPGPGEYEARAQPAAPAFTLAPRHRAPLADAASTAGPAEYDVPAAFPAGPAFSVPRARVPGYAAIADPTPGALRVVAL